MMKTVFNTLFLAKKADNFVIEVFMARILENRYGRRNIILNADDVISLVREYQSLTYGIESYEEIRKILNKNKLYLPEEII